MITKELAMNLFAIGVAATLAGIRTYSQGCTCDRGYPGGCGCGQGCENATDYALQELGEIQWGEGASVFTEDYLR